MSDVISKVLIEAINDEYKARAAYRHVIRKFGKIRPFINIVEAESRHIEALLPLFQKYGVTVPEDNWDLRTEAPQTVLEACQMGVEDEIANAEMYDRLLELTADYPDIQRVLTQLQRASAENHLPAFRRCVEKVEARGKVGGTVIATMPEASRATLADTPEQSDFTSIQRRIDAAKQGQQPKELLPFVGNERKALPKGLVFELTDYLVLVDNTGRIVRGDKRGAIHSGTSQILHRLNIPLESWLKITQDFMGLFKGPVGGLPELKRHCRRLGMQRVAHASSCQHWTS